MPQPILKRTDQAVIACLTLAALICLMGWWVTAYSRPGGLIEIDRAAPLRSQFLVDLNSAEWPELAQLPGIGEVLARRIVAARREKPFRTQDDLLRVRGIGARRLAQMQRYLLPLPDDEMLVQDAPSTGAGS